MTIYALSSGPGISGIAVIRVSGENSKKILSVLTEKPFPKKRVATLKKIKNNINNEIIDEGIVIWFPEPDTYTGEDMVEFHVHGSKAVIDELQNVLSKFEGCRLAEPGEFTKLAFQNNKINLLKAESIGDLIAAETELQRKQALRIMSGHSSKKFNIWREELIKILAEIEAKIDFPEEDISAEISKEIKLNVEKIKKQIQKTLDDNKTGEIIREGFKIAIIGPPNVGKSSLLNYLSKREAAIVSEKAGTTRDVIEVHLDLGGIPVIISDTAGIRDSNDEIEARGAKLAMRRAEDADLNIILLDPKNLDFKGFFNDNLAYKSIIVVNKSDLGIEDLNNIDKKNEPIVISIKLDNNVEKLIETIKTKLKNQFLQTENILITRSRHRQHLYECYEQLNSFLEKKENDEFDKAAEDLRLSIRHLGKIVGRVDVEEILGSIFENFCIGK
jgi:tRNA modification GTPase|tara:strand:+ start:3352 stop:4683 length:1332 start_codon:yes stop_codon:yes gene_type:complete